MLVFRTIIIGTVMLFLALVVGPYIAVQFDYLAPPVPLGWFRLFGVALMLVGVPLMAGCAYLLLVPGKDRAVPYDSPEGMSVIGPYKHIRNPFMLGFLLVLWGEAVFLKSVPLMVYALVMSLCIYFWIVAFEEPSLEDRYGEEYRRYKSQVPRWFPSPKKRS